MRSVIRNIGIFFGLVSMSLAFSSGPLCAGSSVAGSFADPTTQIPVTLVEEGSMDCQISASKENPGVYLKGSYEHKFTLSISPKGHVVGTGTGRFKYTALDEISFSQGRGVLVKASGNSDVSLKGFLKSSPKSDDKHLYLQSREAKNGSNTVQWHFKASPKSKEDIVITCVYDEDAGTTSCDNPIFQNLGPIIAGSLNSGKPERMKEWASPQLNLPFSDGAETNWEYGEPNSGCIVKGTSTLFFEMGD